VAHRALAFGMNVLTYTVPESDFHNANVENVELCDTVENLLERSDFVSVHVPLIP